MASQTWGRNSTALVRKHLGGCKSDSEGKSSTVAMEVDDVTRLAALVKHADALTLLKETFLVGIPASGIVACNGVKVWRSFTRGDRNPCLMTEIGCEIRTIGLVTAFP